MSPPTKTPRVLVVDDNAVIRTVVTGMLEHLGATIDVATNGRDAVAAVTRTRYDLVLMDVRMPELDGPAAARAIRDAARPGEAPRIVGITASVTEATRQACLDGGMSAVLVKPVRLVDLATLLGASPKP